MVCRTAPVSMTLNNPKLCFQGNAILWRWISHKQLKIRPSLLWKANGKPPKLSNGTSLNDLWVTYNTEIKVTIIQRQITRKWYNIELYLRRPTNRKSYNDLSNGAIFNDLERPLPPVSRSLHSLTLKISEMVRDTDSFNGILIRTYTHPTMTRSVARSLCDSWASCFLEWCSRTQELQVGRHGVRQQKKPCHQSSDSFLVRPSHSYSTNAVTTVKECQRRASTLNRLAM